MQPSAKLVYHFGLFQLDTSECILLYNQQHIPITPKAFEILLALVEGGGQILKKEDLMQRVWPDVFVEEINLVKNISDLRKTLGGMDGGQEYIQTIPKRGYRFIVHVRPSWDEGGIIESSSDALMDHEMELADGAVRCGELIGRATELERLQNWLETAVRGKRQVIFVTGEPGIGKTTLVKAFLQRVTANRRFAIAYGQCLEQYGTGEAYLPVFEALSRLCSEPGREKLIKLLAERAPTWLAQMPTLVSAAERAALHQEIFGATRERMLREMTETIEVLTAETPLVLVLEDLHWSDPSTLSLITALAQRSDRARFLLIGTWRPIEVNLSGHPLKATKQELLIHRQCAELQLGLLTEAAVSEYLEARFPQHRFPDGLAPLIYQRTEGNPLFIVNLVDYLAAQGAITSRDGQWELKAALTEIEIGVPESIKQMIERQIDRLSPDEHRLLEAASVDGIGFSAAAVAAALAVDVAQVEEKCERLARNDQFLRSSCISQWPEATETINYNFTHALYQSIFYRHVPPVRRSQLHYRIGEHKELIYGPYAGEIAAELALHFERGRDYRRAVLYLRQAAENALSSFANGEAIDHLTLAIELLKRIPFIEQYGPQMEILERNGLVCRSMNDMRGAIKAYEEMVLCAQKEGRLESKIRALLCLCSGLYWVDRRRCLEMVDQISELGLQLQDGILKTHVRGHCGSWNLLLRGWRYDDFLAVAAAVEELRDTDDRVLFGVCLTRYSAHQNERGEYRAAYHTAEEGLLVTREVGDTFHFIECQVHSALALLHLGEWGKMLEYVRDGLEMAAKNFHHGWTMGLRCLLATLHEAASDFERARELFESVYGQTRAGRTNHIMATIRLGHAYLGLKQYDRAYNCFNEITQWLEDGRMTMECLFYLQLHLGLGLYWLEQGNFAEARHQAQLTYQLASQSGEVTYLALGKQTLAEIAMAEQNHEQAEAELAQAFDVVKRSEAPFAEWQVWQTAARLHSAKGEHVEATRNWERSLTILNRMADSLGHDEPLRQHFVEHLRKSSQPMAGLTHRRREEID
jgi:DNA-binding winged helix-turn-helix (wHTH) protein/tetratricopeptide (TPR) repeat protein